MHLYNVDETGMMTVHKPGKVITQLGHRNVCAVTAAEKGKTHTVILCVSASGFLLPHAIIYLRKQAVLDNLKEEANPHALF